ncbi:MAG: hypothetical protein J6C40_13475 [Lentisphaeria bacterium]|nr:hypothetical protein [Lentisphaeria bacterium]
MAIHEKSHDFFKNGGTKPIHSGKKLDSGEKFRIFFKSSDTKTACPGKKLDGNTMEVTL